MRKIIHPKINYAFRNRRLGFISTFKIIPFQNKLISLNIISSGGVTYLPTSGISKMFQFNYFFNIKSKMRGILNKPTMFLLFNIASFSKISLLELLPGSGIKFIRSSGSVGKIIKKD